MTAIIVSIPPLPSRPFPSLLAQSEYFWFPHAFALTLAQREYLGAVEGMSNERDTAWAPQAQQVEEEGSTLATGSRGTFCSSLFPSFPPK